jgi:catechol 2,3-dioxygenase-like lactoylglutathione lyase family enzyme
MKPVIDHIQITVKDLKTAEVFYDQFLPLLGFDLSRKSAGTVPEHEFEVVEYVHDDLTIGINSPRKAYKDEDVHRRKPGALHHLAFKATSRDAVDTFYEKLKKTGAHIIEPPRLYPQHGENYYALFFKDPGGIKYEVVFEKRT